MHLELTDKEKQQVTDYVLLMLGAPVIKIEMDPQQIDLVLAETINIIDERLSRVPEDKVRKTCLRLVQEGALVHAKIVLGRIRSKFESPPGPGPGGRIKLDGKQLLKEASEDMACWTEKLDTIFPS
jgi:hypothetical protein